MKVLYSAAACSPYQGSELHVGWVWLCAIAAEHDVVLLCSNHDLPHLARAHEEGLIPANVQIVPAGDPVWPFAKNRFLARLQTWKRFYEFNRYSPQAARNILKEHKIDLIHQVTIATWRTGCPLVKLGKPFIWGPIGGAEIFPFSYASCLSPSALFLESSRAISGVISSYSPLTRRTAKEAASIIVTNGDTERKLRKLGRKGPVIRCPMLLDLPRFQRIRELTAKRTRNPGLLRIFCGGTLEARKGFVLSLKAIAQLKIQGIPFHYTFGSHGPDGAWAEKLASDLGITENVTFLPGLKGDEYLQKLVDSDVFLFPSLRDNSPLTLIEAMTAGCLPIVLKAGGPGETVNEECGIIVALSNPSQTVQEIVQALQFCWEHPEQVEVLSKKSVERVHQKFLSSRISDILRRAYSAVKNT